MTAKTTSLEWWGMAALFMTLPMVAQPGQAQPGQAQPGQAQTQGAVPAPNPAVRTEHTPPRRPQQMKTVPRPEPDAQQVSQGSDNASRSGALAPQKTAQDVLAELVKSAGVIFVGQVYAIRMPEGETNPGTKGGLHSSRPHVVEIEFRVDQGVRGPSVGDPFVLRESEDRWHKDASQFTLHQSAIVFLYPPDKDGLSSPVGGAIGVIPKENENQVDLTRLHALVEGAPASGAAASGSSMTTTTEPAAKAVPSAGQTPAPDVTDVSSTAGEQTLISGASRGRMPELDTTHAPFLAVLRDIYVLAAAEQPPAAPKSGL
ncbi:MAG: hypothetical protein ACR2JE_12805 [Acidobacteriaceae bacterium]